MFYHKKGHKEKVLWKKQKDDKVKKCKRQMSFKRYSMMGYSYEMMHLRAKRN